MYLNELYKYANKIKQEHPNLKDDVNEILALAVDEIECGEPESHECELAWDDLEVLEEGANSA